MKKNLLKKNNIQIYKLKKINLQKGNLIKFIEKNSKKYKGFGEVYFSTVKKNKIKAWKKHKKTYSNLVVVYGKVKFLIIDSNSKLKKFILTSKNYKSILIPPNTFYGFMGMGRENIICNFINKPHSLDEHTNKNINYFKYKWH